MLALSTYATRSLSVSEFINLNSSLCTHLRKPQVPFNAFPQLMADLFSMTVMLLRTHWGISVSLLVSFLFSHSFKVKTLRTFSRWNECRWHGCKSIYHVQESSFSLKPLFKTNNTIVMKYQTCKSFFFNSGTVPIGYCRPTWVRCSMAQGIKSTKTHTTQGRETRWNGRVVPLWRK